MPCRLLAVSGHSQRGATQQRTAAPAELTAALQLAMSPARSLNPPLASILLIGNFSGALPAPLCALGALVLVVACDYRECEWASPPAELYLPPRVWETPRCVAGVGSSDRFHRLHQHCAV